MAAVSRSFRKPKQPPAELEGLGVLGPPSDLLPYWGIQTEAARPVSPSGDGPPRGPGVAESAAAPQSPDLSSLVHDIRAGGPPASAALWRLQTLSYVSVAHTAAVVDSGALDLAMARLRVSANFEGDPDIGCPVPENTAARSLVLSLVLRLMTSEIDPREAAALAPPAPPKPPPPIGGGPPAPSDGLIDDLAAAAAAAAAADAAAAGLPLPPSLKRLEARLIRQLDVLKFELAPALSAGRLGLLDGLDPWVAASGLLTLLLYLLRNRASDVAAITVDVELMAERLVSKLTARFDYWRFLETHTEADAQAEIMTVSGTYVYASLLVAGLARRSPTARGHLVAAGGLAALADLAEGKTLDGRFPAAVAAYFRGAAGVGLAELLAGAPPAALEPPVPLTPSSGTPAMTPAMTPAQTQAQTQTGGSRALSAFESLLSLDTPWATMTAIRGLAELAARPGWARRTLLAMVAVVGGGTKPACARGAAAEVLAWAAEADPAATAAASLGPLLELWRGEDDAAGSLATDALAAMAGAPGPRGVLLPAAAALLMRTGGQGGRTRAALLVYKVALSAWPACVPDVAASGAVPELVKLLDSSAAAAAAGGPDSGGAAAPLGVALSALLRLSFVLPLRRAIAGAGGQAAAERVILLPTQPGAAGAAGGGIGAKGLDPTVGIVFKGTAVALRKVLQSVVWSR